MKKRSSQIGESEQEDTQLRKQWAEEFLSQGGFEHILNDFMACSVASDSDSSSKDSSESFAAEIPCIHAAPVADFCNGCFLNQ